MKFRIAAVRGTPVLILALVSAGCASVKYHPNSAAGPARPADYPIPVYTKDMTVPRPCQVIGTVTINPGSFSMFGGSAEAEMIKVMEKAHEKGADVVKFTSVERPDFTNPNYQMTAQLLRYADVWETIPISRKDFAAYLEENQKYLDPIEGIWYSGGPNAREIGIMKDRSKAGRDFVGFILNAKNPAWRAGYKKMDVRHGLKPGSYVLNYYFNDFDRAQISFFLGDQRKFTFDYQRGPEDEFFTYVKE